MPASNTDYFKKARRKFSTRIQSGGIDGATTTIPLVDVTGMDTDTAVIITVDARTEKEEVISGVVSGSSLVNALRGLEGTAAQSHTGGALVTMYFTESHWDSLINGLLVEHTQTGQHKNLSSDAFVDGVNNKVYTSAEKSKLAGIQSGATANDTDANLKSRANHTGTQTSATISDFTSAVQALIPAFTPANATTTTVSQTGHGLSIGNLVRLSGSTYIKAQADTEVNAEVVGIVTTVANANSFSFASAGRATGLSGLAAGTVYFLSDAQAGLLTDTPPTAINTVRKPVLVADSPSSGIFINMLGAVNLEPDDSTSESSTIQVVQSNHGFDLGDWVYHNGSTYVLSQANAPKTAYVIGMVSNVISQGQFEITTGGLVTGLSNLVAGKNYFLDEFIPGGMSVFPPYSNDTVAKLIFHAVSTTSGVVNIQRGKVNVVARTWSKLGMNFGLNGVPFDRNQVEQDLLYLQRYITRLRLSIPAYDNTDGITTMRSHVLIARDMGFKTTYGITCAGMGRTLANYNSWKSQVPTEAAWANANGVDTFYIGNEEDRFASTEVGGITGVTPAQVRTDVLNMASTLKGQYPNLRIVYSTSEAENPGWNSVGTGALDALGMNLYNDDFAGTIDYFSTMSFYPKMFISEFNTNPPFTSGTMNAAQYRAELKNRVKAIRDRGLEAYFFTWDWGGDYGTQEDWGIKNGDGTFKPGIEELFSIPR